MAENFLKDSEGYVRAITTTNLSLEKPLTSDNYDIGVQNRNMDKIDAAIHEVSGKVDDLTSEKVLRPSGENVESSLSKTENDILNLGKEIEKTNTNVNQISSDSSAWQKYKVTDDIGRCKLCNKQDANSIILAGLYNGNEMVNMPNNSAEWWYLEVIPHSGSGYCYQIATQLVSEYPKKYHRNQINGAWNPWRRL